MADKCEWCKQRTIAGFPYLIQKDGQIKQFWQEVCLKCGNMHEYQKKEGTLQ